jgi:hypothetical protein
MVKYGVLFEVRTEFLSMVYKDDLGFQKVNGQIFLQKKYYAGCWTSCPEVFRVFSQSLQVNAGIP